MLLVLPLMNGPTDINSVSNLRPISGPSPALVVFRLGVVPEKRIHPGAKRTKTKPGERTIGEASTHRPIRSVGPPTVDDLEREVHRKMKVRMCRT